MFAVKVFEAILKANVGDSAAALFNSICRETEIAQASLSTRQLCGLALKAFSLIESLKLAVTTIDQVAERRKRLIREIEERERNLEKKSRVRKQ